MLKVDEFELHRDYLHGLAYRMLGTQADADDVLQEAYVRWTADERDDVRSPRSYLASVVTRLCIDRRREIEARKETYVGPWLPEPIVEPPSQIKADYVETAETISLAFLHLLESLSPVERAAYLLRQVFDYEYAEISEILGKSEANCRQLVSRADDRIKAQRPRFQAKPEEVQRISDEFLQACSTGNLQGLVQLLADDVVIYSDGGGKATAALRPLEGIDRASRFLAGVFKKAPAALRIQPVRVNDQPGFAVFDGERLITVVAFAAAEGRIQRCFLIRNPEKLARAKVR